MFIWCFCVFYYLQIKSSIHCELSDSVSTSLVLKGPWLTKFDVKAQRGTKVLFKASLSQTRISGDTWTLLFVCFLLVLLVHHIHSYKSSCKAHLFTTRILQKSSRNYSNFIQTSKRSIGAPRRQQFCLRTSESEEGTLLSLCSQQFWLKNTCGQSARGYI